MFLRLLVFSCQCTSLLRRFLENVQQTSLRDGLQEWTLNATSATLFETEKKAVIDEPVLTFYTKEKDNIHLTAREGILKTDTSDIEVTGNVVVKNSLYQMKTQQLLYRHDTRIIHSPTFPFCTFLPR